MKEEFEQEIKDNRNGCFYLAVIVAAFWATVITLAVIFL